MANTLRAQIQQGLRLNTSVQNQIEETMANGQTQHEASTIDVLSDCVLISGVV